MHWLPRIAHTILFALYKYIYRRWIITELQLLKTNKQKNLTATFGMTSDHSYKGEN